MVVDGCDVMLDLETMGQRPGCVIASIGAAKFNIETGYWAPSFYRVIDLETASKIGFRFDGATVTWWLRQSEAARWALTEDQRAPIGAALIAFVTWVEQLPTPVRIWAKDPDFDLTILEAALTKLNFRAPWNHRAGRSVRTIEDLAERFGWQKPEVDPQIVQHNAMDDVREQVRRVSSAYRWLRSCRR